MESSDNGLIDAARVLQSLAAKRPTFHSEADFQFAFAWEAKLGSPDLEVRLETHPEPAVRLDLELLDSRSGIGVAIEMKYMTRFWSGRHGSETFSLKNHGASDLRGYDIVKDIVRVERFVAARPSWSGLVIVLTNEASYWRPRTHGRATNADAFRISEGTLLAGQRGWGPRTGGTAKGHEAPLQLAGEYALEWTDYSRLDSSRAGTFRSLTIEIGGTSAVGT
ncbi:hypothetical protein [Flexivirga endophytica]|uniref:hypothetical protein n=1 Tax=Flexivirga endophytica TaxID=1849103 RepID=UPI00166C1202|nr:hypothetical protein [Flexivirga endophytica]